MKYLARVGLACLLGLGYVASASAHAHLKAAEPGQNASVAAPNALSLHFTEGLELAFSGVSVTGPGQKAVPLGSAHTAAGDDATLVVPLSQPLVPGVYTVDWHALAKDGHKTRGSYAFTVTQ
ncbi:MAG TPA: copper homeostasis periplasmic binding protein CopC [Bordetella sp.]